MTQMGADFSLATARGGDLDATSDPQMKKMHSLPLVNALDAMNTAADGADGRRFSLATARVEDLGGDVCSKELNLRNPRNLRLAFQKTEDR